MKMGGWNADKHDFSFKIIIIFKPEFFQLYYIIKP